MWSAATDAHTLYAPFRDKWHSLGRDEGTLGLPVTDEQETPNGQGRFAHFEGGSLYQKDGSDIFMVRAGIRDQWQNAGWEAGRYGFPVSDEYSIDGGQGQNFEHGIIYSNLGEQQSAFDHPSGPCPEQICVDGETIPSENQVPGIQRQLEPSMPTCAEVSRMPKNPNPDVVIACIDTAAKPRSGEQMAPMSKPQPSDSVVEEACWNNYPRQYTRRLYSCRASWLFRIWSA